MRKIAVILALLFATLTLSAQDGPGSIFRFRSRQTGLITYSYKWLNAKYGLQTIVIDQSNVKQTNGEILLKEFERIDNEYDYETRVKVKLLEQRSEGRYYRKFVIEEVNVELKLIKD